jgi:hypothetical protein
MKKILEDLTLSETQVLNNGKISNFSNTYTYGCLKI